MVEFKRRGKKKPETMEGRKPLVRTGALWLKKGKNGTFMSGVIDIDDDTRISIIVFKNGYKEQANQPDYVIYVPEEEDATEGREEAKEKFKATDGDIPF